MRTGGRRHGGWLGMGQAIPINMHAILLVEDEVFIRTELAAFFTDAGYQVFEAGDADEAIDTLETEMTIRIVLTDIQLPGVNGRPRARTLCPRQVSAHRPSADIRGRTHR